MVKLQKGKCTIVIILLKVLPTDAELAVHLPEWQDRQTRGTDFRKSSGIKLNGKLIHILLDKIFVA